MKKKIVVKIGTSTLTMGTDRISRGKLEDIARQLIKLKDKFHIIILVMIVVTALLKVVVEMLGLMLEIMKL